MHKNSDVIINKSRRGDIQDLFSEISPSYEKEDDAIVMNFEQDKQLCYIEHFRLIRTSFITTSFKTTTILGAVYKLT